MRINWKSLVFRSLDPDRPLDAKSILQRGSLDVTSTGALFLLFVAVTAALRSAVESTVDSPIHHSVLRILEYIIFFSGAFIILLATIYLMIVMCLDLWRSLHNTPRTRSVSEEQRNPPFQPPLTSDSTKASHV